MMYAYIYNNVYIYSIFSIHNVHLKNYCILVFISVLNNISEEPIKVVVEHHQTCVVGIII